MYYFYYYKTNALLKVAKDVFLKPKAKVLEFQDFKIKLIGEGDHKLARRVFSKFRAQGGLDSLKLAGQGCKLVYEILIALGKVREKVQSISKTMLLELTRILLDLSKVFSGKWTGVDLVSLLISLYVFFEKFNMKAQGVDQFILAGASLFLPDSFFKIVQRASVFSGSKLCDDVSIFHSLISCVHDSIGWLCNFLNLSDETINKVNKIFEVLCVSKSHLNVKRMRLLNEHFKKSSKHYLDKDLNVECKKLLEEVDNEEMSEWSRRSAGVKEILNRFKLNCKIIHQNCNVVRPEPNCFVFEGPPGTGKSVAMNLLLQVMGETCYAHVVKSVMDGKDFYDTYNNEEIFFMDDVGQQGVSQWRQIINMVSVVKLPLDCAAADLKDTKFFNSNKIFTTTNNFTNLQNQLSKTDGISDIHALWRRGYVFDFKNTRFVQGSYIGEVEFKYFNVDIREFKNEFPEIFKIYAQQNNINLEPKFQFKAEEVNNKVNFVAWLVNIIKIFDKIKQQHLNNNSVGVDFVNLVKERLIYRAEGSWDDIFNWRAKEKVVDDRGELMARNNLVFGPIIEDRRYDVRIQTDALGQQNFIITESGIGWWKELIWETMMYIFRKYLKSLEGIEALLLMGQNFIVENAILILAIMAVINMCYYFFGIGKEECSITVDWKGEGIAALKMDGAVHSSINFLQKSLYLVDVNYNSRVITGTAILTGHLIILPSHYIQGDKAVIRVYKDSKKKNIV